MFVRIKETVAEKLRGLCAGLSPEKRMLTVIVLAVLFALGNFYLIFRAIYDIGREDVQRDIIEIAPLDIPDIVPADTLPDKRVQEMEEFLTDSIRKKMSNDINKLKQRLEIRKYLVFAGMFLLFLGATWLIFAPSEEDKQKEEKNAGFNTELPDPRGAGIEEDKIAAYEQADIKRKQAEKCVHWETSQVLRMKTPELSWHCHRMRIPRMAVHVQVTVGMKPALHPSPPTITSTGLSATFTSHRRKTRKRRR